jgi:hypothetical protein
MSGKETVIKAIEYLNWYFTQDDGAADKNAVKAWEVLIREQEPVKPKRVSTIVDTFTYFVCGSCEMPIGLTDRYCSHCGKKVKWDG